MEEETQSIKDAERVMRAWVFACQRRDLQEIRSVGCSVDALLWQRTGLKDTARKGKGRGEKGEGKRKERQKMVETGDRERLYEKRAERLAKPG